MSEDEKKTRKFQYALTKAQVDFEFWLALAIGILAIAYGLLSFYKDNFLGTVLTNVLILVAVVYLIRIYYIKEENFKTIKKLYIDD
jgi:hypothetical protein